MILYTGSDWVVANSELTPANRFCIKDLTTGDRVNVRVVAVNAGGRSEAGALVEPVPIREVVGELGIWLEVWGISKLQNIVHCKVYSLVLYPVS